MKVPAPANRERSGLDDTWMASVAAAAVFHTVHGHCPRSRSADQEEAKLGRFLRTWRYGATIFAAGWSEERQDHINVAYPGWRGLGKPLSLEHPDVAARFEVRTLELGAFVDAHGRLPSKDATAAAERSLYGWLHYWRRMAASRSGAWTAERQRTVTTAVPCWRGSTQVPWEVRAMSCAAFHARHGRRPSRAAWNTAERADGIWLEHVQSAARRGTRGWTPDRLARLDVLYPLWLDRVRPPWEDNARACAAFREAHGRAPRQHGVPSDEVRLGRWLQSVRGRVRAGAPSWSADRVVQLEAIYPQWRGACRPPRMGAL